MSSHSRTVPPPASRPRVSASRPPKLDSSSGSAGAGGLRRAGGSPGRGLLAGRGGRCFRGLCFRGRCFRGRCGRRGLRDDDEKHERNRRSNHAHCRTERGDVEARSFDVLVAHVRIHLIAVVAAYIVLLLVSRRQRREYLAQIEHPGGPVRLTRNNLDLSVSPYLRQHRENPVWWQEWSQEVLDHARETDRILLVSVGYATCHWCHVMAADAFSDPDVAAYLNEHFMPIKVDREQRPDIDQMLMDFLVQTTGQGGWPLNAFLSPRLEPFFAMTYAATESRYGIPSFLDILHRVVEFYGANKDELKPFEVRAPAPAPGGGPRGGNTGSPGAEGGTGSPGEGGEGREDAELARITEAISRAFDEEHAGFGSSQKFPPHSTLLYLLNRYADSRYAGTPDETAGHIARNTLETMQRRGLHDHLQGGFFRYCVDRAWTIPHFEKMLYDQALLLWSFSLGARVFSREDFRRTAEGIYRCLEETFAEDGVYVSGHDADTDHVEGATYVWTPAEIEAVLGAEDAAFFGEIYDIE